MNGEIPSVPITTLAGISSLTDLLPEMPLPSPLPQTLSNKSLLFHPRVAEEAQILLSVRDEALVPQLIQSLVQTSSDHIELKDHYAGTEHPAEHQQNIPELLKAILQRNPSVFKGSSLAGWPGQATAASLVANSHASPGSGFGHPQQSQQQQQQQQQQPAPQQQPPPMPPNLSVANNHVLVHSGQNTQSLHPSMLNTAMVAQNLLPSPSHLTQQSQQPPTQIAVPYSHSPSVNHMLIGTNPHSRASIPMSSHPVAIPSALEETNDHMNLLLSGPSASETTTYDSHTPYAPTPTDAHQAHLPPQPQPTQIQHQVRSSMHPIAAPLDGQQRVNCVSLLDQNRTANGVIDSSSQSTETCSVSPGTMATRTEDVVSSSPRTQASHLPGSSPAQASVAPVPPNVIFKEPVVKLEPLKHELLQHQLQLHHQQQPQQQQQQSTTTQSKMNSSAATGKMKIPIVRLNRLSAEDQALMQKSISKFAEKSPNLASKLGITVKNKNSHINESQDIKSESDSEDDHKKKPKYFKAREKEREIQRQREREKRKKKYYGDMDDDNNDIDDDEDFNVNSQERSKRHGRSNLNTSRSLNPSSNTSEPIISKPKLRKIEKKLVKTEEKLSIEELMETNTYQRFNRSIDTIFENTEDLDLTTELDDEADVPAEALIPKYQLQDLCSEAAKLKTLGAMESIPAERLVRLLNILEKNIRDGVKVSPIADPDDDEDESKLWLELTMERVMRAADASLTALYIMTSANMPKQIYLEDVIDRVVAFTKYQLHHTIYPSFDPVYRVDPKGKDHGHGRKKHRGHGKEVREKSILTLYNKLHELVSVLAELLHIQVLTDTAVLHASSMGVAPFFVESVSELQLSALRLVTVIFTKYEKHRRLLLDDILASIARLPSSKRSLRTYRLNSEEHIQMLTALVLQLIQCVVALPDNLCGDSSMVPTSLSSSSEDTKTPSVDRDVLIVNKYETATMTAANFLTVFLNKCGSKSEEIDYRPLFENFVQDLLTTVNKPEWPATELLLSLLGKLLVNNFSNKSVDMSLRVASLDYLGVVAARLRKDAVVSHLKIDTIDQIINEIKLEEQRDEESSIRKSVSKSESELSEEERTQFLQRVLLDYLAVTGQNDPALYYSRHFYIAQWYRDATVDRTSPAKPSRPKPVSKEKGRRKRRGAVISSDEEDPPSSTSEKEEEGEKPDAASDKSAAYRLSEQTKNFLISKIKPFQEKGTGSNRVHVSQTYIDYCNAELISRYLASKRSFSKSFDLYLKQILCVLTESSIAIRTKALKCLTMVVEADPSVLARLDMQTGVRHSFLDHATSVREAAVDLVGKFVLSRPELIDKYYGMLLSRILDTGVSVRKRVIKILKDICIECPEFPKIPEICVKMIRRVNDEEGIRKLVMEVFQNMWFTPVRERPQQDHATLLRKVMNITNVVAASKEIGLEWFEQLLLSLFKPKEDKEDSTKIHSEPPKPLLTACKQIVDCLIENVLRLEEAPDVTGASTSNGNGNASGDGPSSGGAGSSQRLVACLTTLYLFAKIRPQLLVNHAITLQPYLSLKCLTKCDYELIGFVARTLELVVPLMEHPSETFLAQLEEDSVKLILQHDKTVVASCLSCLGSVVNNVTRNFKLIRDCFQKYYGHLTDYKNVYQSNPDNPNLIRARPFFRRALYTVGLLLRHFDFMDKDVIQGLPENIKDQVFETFIYFVQQPNEDIQTYTLKAIGSLCIRYYDFMLGIDLKSLYHKFLTDEDAPLQMRTQVLNNIEMYLDEEERRMIRQDREWAKLSKQENLKEMGDISSGMASTIIQVYLKEILESFLHPNINVRHAALKVIQLILQQGLVHPVQIVPYLICMSTDVEKMVSHSADKQLQDIEKKYPGFIHMKSLTGIRLSYKLQRILQGPSGPVRGFRLKEGEMPGALNGFLYSILRGTRQQRRGLVLSILKQFDEQVKTSLGQMLYLSDNLAYFPYQVQDEPLFIIHQIDIMISVSGTNLLQAFREALLPLPNAPGPPPPSMAINDSCMGQEAGAGINEQTTANTNYLEEEDEDEDQEILLSRVPEDTRILQECITASQGCLLLLVLKQHLKDLYGISDAKITQYSPSESAKIYEKTVNRKSNSQFNPKATLSKLREEEPTADLDITARKALIEQYLDFKQLMLKFDPEDLDDDDAPPTKQGGKGSISSGATPSTPGHGRTGGPLGPTQPTQTPGVNTGSGEQAVEAESEKSDLKETPRKIPKLTIVPPKPSLKESKSHKLHKSHKSERKKHRHKKKRRKELSDSENEYSDPDFLV